jgi:(2R)-sulfolactate sulfo-lyase subunit alpha
MSEARQIPHVLAHSPKDNVAVVVVEGLKAGTEAFGVVTENNAAFTVAVKHDIPIGHKVALADFREGDTAIKYGQDVGRVVQPIRKGEHVHVHNLKTKRW